MFSIISKNITNVNKKGGSLCQRKKRISQKNKFKAQALEKGKNNKTNDKAVIINTTVSFF
jgi:hypothetical protein